MCADDSLRDAVWLEDGMDVLDGFLADIGLFRKGSKRNGCIGACVADDYGKKR